MNWADTSNFSIYEQSYVCDMREGFSINVYFDGKEWWAIYRGFGYDYEKRNTRRLWEAKTVQEAKRLAREVYVKWVNQWIANATQALENIKIYED